MEQNCPFSKEDIEEFKDVGLDIDNNFLRDDKIINELKYCMKILEIDIELRYLLLAMKKQNIHENVCDQLLQKMNKDI